MSKKKQRDDAMYDRVKRYDFNIYTQIVAFASTFGREDEISHSTRFEVERFCMGLVTQILGREEAKP